MRRTERYIVIALLCCVMMLAVALGLTSCVGGAEAPRKTVDPAKMIHPPVIETPKPWDTPEAKEMKATVIIHEAEIEETDAPTAELEGTGEDAQESEPMDYAALVDLNEWGESATYLAKTVWGEAWGCDTMQQAAVVWCVLNRVDAGSAAGFRETIAGVVTQPAQFAGYRAETPVTEELYALALDVLGRWLAEKDGAENVGQVLPSEFCWFTGNGSINTFRDAYKGNYSVWAWDCENPYEVE